MGKVLRRTLGGIAVAAAVAVAAPFLIPVSHFIPQLALFASEKLGQPVTIEDLRLHLLPTPRVVAHRITVGRKAQLLIGELEIEPDLVSLAFGPRTIKLIRADRVAIDEAALAIPRGMPKSRPGEPVLVHRLVLTSVRLNHSKLDLPLFHVDVELGEGLRMREARLETSDGSLRVRVEPRGDETTAIVLNGAHWTLPIGAPLIFEAIAAQGTLKGQHLDLTKIEADLYGGKLVGAAHANWGKQWQLAGTAQLAGVDLVSLQKALGKTAKLSGRLRADAAFSTRANSPALLRDALTLEGPFEVLGGVYQGMDLSRAGDLGGERRTGDATTFEELKGRVELRGQQVRLSELCMRSPKMVAGGNLEIAADKVLSGRLDISMAQTGGLVGIPVSLGGTTDEPTMRPSKGYLIGAAIGTVLLPGIGTSIGSSLGGRIEGTSDCK
jgi:AsmA-like C-terminal region